jgi:hypothetical protein
MSDRTARNWPILGLHLLAWIGALIGAWTEREHILLVAIAAMASAAVCVLLDISEHLRQILYGNDTKPKP